jgi:hypothetical protein
LIKIFVAYTEFGNSRILSLERFLFLSKHVKRTNQGFFNDSLSQFASFFTNETNLTAKELEELKKIIDTAILKRKNDRLF